MKFPQKPHQEKLHISETDFPVDVFINDLNPMNVRPHWHKGIEILFVLKGKTEMIVKDKSFEVEKGDLIILNQDSIHGTSSLSDNTEILVIQFMSNLIEHYSNMFESKYIIPFLKYNTQEYVYYSLEEGEDIYDIIFRIYDEYKKKETAYELYIKGSILQLISSIMRNDILEIEKNNLPTFIFISEIGKSFRYDCWSRRTPILRNN